MKTNLEDVKKLKKNLMIKIDNFYSKYSKKSIISLIAVFSLFLIYQLNTKSEVDKKKEYLAANKQVENVDFRILKIKLDEKMKRLKLPNFHEKNENIQDYYITSFQNNTLLQEQGKNQHQQKSNTIIFPKNKNVIAIKTNKQVFYWINEKVYLQPKPESQGAKP